MRILREPLKRRSSLVSASNLFLRTLLSCMLLLGAGSAVALIPGDHVADFKLKDETGASHELYGLSSKKAIVIMTQSNGCPIVRLAVPALREIKDRYSKQDIEFLLLNPT